MLTLFKFFIKKIDGKKWQDNIIEIHSKKGRTELSYHG